MGNLILRHSKGWANKPPPGARVDWNHPLSKSLSLCYLINERGDNILYDLVNRKYNAYRQKAAGSSSPQWGYGKYGACMIYGLGGVPTNSGSHDTKFSPTIKNSYTIVVAVAPTVDHKILGTRGPSDSSFDMEMQAGTPNNIHYDIGTGSSWIATNINAYSTKLANYRWVQITTVVNATSLRAWFDGVPASDYNANTYSATTPLFSDSTHLLAIGNYKIGDTTSAAMLGSIAYVYAYNRALSECEIKQLYANPYCFIKSPVRRTYFTSPAVRRVQYVTRKVRW